MRGPGAIGILVLPLCGAALIAAAEKNSGFVVYNVGTGKNYDLNSLVERINSVLGISIEPKYIEMSVKDLHRLYAYISGSA